MSISNSNFIYTGSIRHRRFSPFDHLFNYKIFMVYFDISKVESILRKSWLWNINKPSIVSFYRKDYHGDNTKSLEESVRNTIYEKSGKKIIGPIRILTHLRYFGYCFNPVSFYYCFDEADKNIELIMAEVTNTPWQERHCYIISNKTEKKSRITANLKKEFHVSPFWDMEHDYEWIFSNPEKNIFVNMKNYKDKKKVFDATLKLKREKLNTKNLLMNVIQFPFITMTIVFKIHLQALKLWFKGATFYTHPRKVK